MNLAHHLMPEMAPEPANCRDVFKISEKWRPILENVGLEVPCEFRTHQWVIEIEKHEDDRPHCVG